MFRFILSWVPLVLSVAALWLSIRNSRRARAMFLAGRRAEAVEVLGFLVLAQQAATDVDQVAVAYLLHCQNDLGLKVAE